MESNIQENPEQNKSEKEIEEEQKNNEKEEFNPANVIDSRLLKAGEYQLHVFK